MIFIARSYGQLGNRLFLYAHMIAAARHHGIAVSNPCFAEYAHLFIGTANDLWCRYPRVTDLGPPPSLRRRKAASKAIYLFARGLCHLGLTRYPVNVVRLRGAEACDLATDEFAALAQQDRHLFALGWLFRSESLLREHAAAVKKHLQITPSHRRNVDNLIKSVRSRADVVIGVHIRQGDYATYLDGKYFYTIGQYVQAMRDVADQIPGKRVAFLVCSNTKLDRSDFADLNVHFGPGHIVEDMYSFAESDLLIGPPSTYTGWASFFGTVPLVVMHEAGMPLELPADWEQRPAA